MFCVKCGHQLQTNYKFCPKCGAKQSGLVAQHSSADGVKCPQMTREAEVISQASCDSKPSSAGGAVVKASTGLSVSISYKMNGLTETTKLSLPCIIGRSSEWPLLLADEKVSQQHAKVYLKNSSAMIEDLCSLNGTFVNGEKIKGPVELLSGDEVKIGMTNLYFVVSAEN